MIKVREKDNRNGDWKGIAGEVERKPEGEVKKALQSRGVISCIRW